MPRPAAVDPHFPARLRELRQERGYSLRELARRSFYSKSYLHELETGGKAPTSDTADRLDTALDAGRCA